MNIGFDLDGIFVDTPPLIPKKVIEWLHRKKGPTLTYRIPGKLEQYIREVSHAGLLRPRIAENILLLRNKTLKSNHTYTLISGRFGFLKRETACILMRYGIRDLFDYQFFNYANEQPHLFKNSIIKEQRVHRYVDDDLPLIEFLAAKHRHIRFFWFNKKEKRVRGKNIIAITSLSEVFKK